jgi:hypothetical protein
VVTARPEVPASGAARVGIDLVVDALATYRLTRLATADVISEPFRRSLVGRILGWSEEEIAAASPTSVEAVDALESPPKAARLLTCRWCAGMWIAGGVVASRTFAPQAWDPVARGLALSSAAALIARLETD